ncbi:MAG: hypothetical protein ACT4P6_20855, partial [Gemmatimonadaceae bacterium]
LALVYSEARTFEERRWQPLQSLSAALLSGSMIAALTIVVIPTAPWFRGRLMLASIVLGVPLGIGLKMLATRLARRTAPEPALRMDAVAAILAALNLILLLALALRGGLTVPAGSIYALAIQVTGFLWPLYFFIGAGVVFKILRKTTTVQRVAEVTLPARFFVPLSLTLLFGAAAIAWIKPVLLLPAFPWPRWILAVADWLYRMSGWVWQSSLLRLTLDPLKWVFLLALAVATWALIQRRLTSAAMARILFAVILITFAVTEYYFQAFGVTRTPRTSALSLFIFTAFVLWLVHRTAVPYLMQESRWWSAHGRIALHGAVLMFVLLPIHARAALHDRSVTNEIFLYLFYGALNFGLPYYLYLYANRRFKHLTDTLSAATALGWVLIGAALSVALTVGDKVATADWSLPAAWATATGQAQALLDERRQITTSVLLPGTWVVLRGLVVISTLLIVGLVARRQQLDGKAARAARAASVFAIVGVAAGLACFSNRGIELPLLPQSLTSFIAPVHTGAMVDASLMMRQLAILLPAMMLGLALGQNAAGVRRFAWLALAFVTHVGLGLLWPAREPWLRSTGAAFSTIAIAFIALLALALAVRDVLESEGSAGVATENSSHTAAPLVLWPELRAAVVVCGVLLGSLAVTRIVAGRGKDVTIAGTQMALRLPVRWVPSVSDSARGERRFSHPSWSGTAATLATQLRRGTADSTELGLLREAIAQTGVADVEALTLERWEHLSDATFALDFRVKRAPDDGNAPGFGTAAVKRMPNGDALFITALYSSIDAARRWDIVRAIQALPR